ncbi:hypothetical protein Q5752_000621 [Cryptotrichosporon argae]
MNDAALLGLNRVAGGTPPLKEGRKARVLGMGARLKAETDGVVKRRTGGVLARGFILKTDHYPSGRALDLDLNIQGAPNFRAPDEEGLNVFGVAQPTVPGLKSILAILGCQPGLAAAATVAVNGNRTELAPLVKTESAPSPPSRRGSAPQESGQAIWFSTREETLTDGSNGRPYVLRDASSPFSVLALSDRASNLEDIERRLKLDILDEARRYGGLLLTHDEAEDGTIEPTWVSVDEGNVRTPKEVYEDVQRDGWRVQYWRIPVAPDRPIEDNYLDAYASRLRDVEPLNTSLVFNCGMGVVRTTFAMVAALLVRRKQYLNRGLDDPFPLGAGMSGFATPASHASPSPVVQFMEQTTQQQALNKSLLKLTRLLDHHLPSRRPASAVELLASHPNLLEQMRKAHMGNYQIVLSLLSSLDHGRHIKRLVDTIIDSCDVVVNLRENVLEHRIKYSVSAMDDKKAQMLLAKAVRSLEQYFDLIVFAAYVEEEFSQDSGTTFSSWLLSRPEIWNQIKVIRRAGGHRLHVFAPVNDLSLISRSSDLIDRRDRQSGREIGLQGKVLGDEWAEHVVKNRNGIMLRSSTLLKSDLWLSDVASSADGVRGAIGFRQIPGASVYATGQPTQNAIETILESVKQRTPDVTNIVWVCLREEPLVMINGSPYCLRRDQFALRNMRDYTGVSAARLEVLEERLKSDVVAELAEFQGRVLLHSETPDGQVVPIWESVDKEDVASIREIMDGVRSDALNLSFVRIPITSESSPDFHDITELLDLCVHNDLSKTAIILNDQLGRGRSSTAAVIVLLIQRWLRDGQETGARPDMPRCQTAAVPKTSWQIINSCLRVIRNGLKVKRVVDEAIDRTSAHFNLRDAIEDLRIEAVQATTPEARNSAIDRGMYNLLRYFHLLVFQAYLDDRRPDDENPYTFESFVKHRPVFKTLETELLKGGLQSLTPIERMEPSSGMALPDEVTQVVANRAGAILSAQTILKSDFFSGLQKQSLPERVEGAANYRRVSVPPDGEHFVYGTGMPSVPGLKNALAKMEADPEGKRKVLWTSLREEPVLYVKSRPHVLRLVDKPLNNVETTGVTASVVERMEAQLKDDVLHEIRAGSGRLLLHDEVETKPGTYEVIPIWETVDEADVATPRELYESVVKDRYQVDYMRIAITDEQAPLPAALQTLLGRAVKGLEQGADFVFNCQMGRGRTTTGMIAATLVAAVHAGVKLDPVHDEDDQDEVHEAAAYQNGEYKTILQLVTVLSHGKDAKRLTDHVINMMEGVQNLRKAVYDFKIKVDAAEPGSQKYTSLMHQGVNYLYRYGALIVFANFLLEMTEQGTPLGEADFPKWLLARREIRTVLSRETLD